MYGEEWGGARCFHRGEKRGIRTKYRVTQKVADWTARTRTPLKGILVNR